MHQYLAHLHDQVTQIEEIVRGFDARQALGQFSSRYPLSDTYCNEKMAEAAKTIYKLASDPLSTALCD